MYYYHNTEFCFCRGQKIAYDYVGTDEEKTDAEFDKLEDRMENINKFSANMLFTFNRTKSKSPQSVKESDTMLKDAKFYTNLDDFLKKLKSWQPVLNPPKQVKEIKSIQPAMEHEAKELQHSARVNDRHASRIQLKYELQIISLLRNYLKEHHVRDRQDTIVNCLDKIEWYDAGYDIDRLMFQVYSLLTTKDHNKKCALLARRYQKGMKRADPLNMSKRQTHIVEHDPFALDYHLVTEPSVVQLLWQSDLARSVIQLWLESFARIKSRYSEEVKSGSAKECRRANRIIDLLYGFRTSHGMHLNGYHRYHKRILGKQQWKRAWSQACRPLYSLWD